MSLAGTTALAAGLPTVPPTSIKVVLDDNYPPYTFKDDAGQAQGILRDVWTLWEQRTGIKVDFAPMDWGKARAAMERGNADVIDTIFETPERQRIYDFSKPYATIDVNIFFDQAISGITDEQSLRGFAVAVKEGDACIEHLAKFGITTLKTYPSYAAEVEAAALQEVRVLCIDKPAGLYFLNRRGIANNFRFTQPLYTGQFHWAVAKGNTALHQIVEAGFAKITPAEREAIEQKWLGTQVQSPLSGLFADYGLAAVASIVAIVALLLLWNTTLRRRVAERTHSLSAMVRTLESSERRFRTLFEQANDAIIIMRGPVAIDCNLSTEKLYGVSRAQIIGTTPISLSPPQQPNGRDSKEMLHEVVAKAQRGEAANFMWRNIRHDGSLIDVDVSLNQIDYEGEPCLQAIVRDITERQQQLERFRAATALQAAILDSAAVSIISTNPEGIITSFNRGAENMLGYTAAEVVNITSPAIIHDPDEVVARAKEFSAELGTPVTPGFEVFVVRSRAGLPNSYEWTYISKDGARVPVLLSVSALRDTDGEIVGYLGIAVDITANKHVEAQLLRMKEHAEAANVAKSQFLATMSHEIRTPMNGILGMAQLLLMEDIDDADRAEFVRTILSSGKTLLTILNDILDLSKIEAGKLELNLAPFDPCALVSETVALFQETARNKGLELIAEGLSADMSTGGRYLGDSIRLRQMLSNYVSNAIKFSESGRIVVSVKQLSVRAPDDDSPVSLEYSVSDQGMGIPAAKLDQLFAPFVQVDSSSTRRFGGTGLGLSIVRRLAEQMGGSVAVDSREGEGTRFSFVIQATPVTRHSDTRSHARSHSHAPLVKQPAGLASDWILVVDDVATNRLVVESMLSKLGLHTRSVADGKQAVELLIETESAPPRVVLMDCQMPVMNGYEATETIRRREAELKLPHQTIIALTAGAFDDDRQHCVDVGMDGYLAKPVEFDKLAAALSRSVE